MLLRFMYILLMNVTNNIRTDDRLINNYIKLLHV